MPMHWLGLLTQVRGCLPDAQAGGRAGFRPGASIRFPWSLWQTICTIFLPKFLFCD